MKPSEEVIDLPADARLVTDLQNGTVRLLKGNKLSEPLLNNEVFRDAVACGSAGKIAILFINAYRKLFRLCHPERELIIATTQTDTLGLTHVRLAQYYKGFRVQPADLNVHLDKQGHVYLVQGRYVPTPVHLDVNPGLSESEIKDAAAADLGGDAKQLAFRSKLVIYAGSRSTPKLAYQIYVESNLFEAWEYMIDAHTGAVLQKTPAIQTRGIPENPSQGGILLK